MPDHFFILLPNKKRPITIPAPVPIANPLRKLTLF
jgi:hypothetical protein